jgi:hypothetical protein
MCVLEQFYCCVQIVFSLEGERESETIIIQKEKRVRGNILLAADYVLERDGRVWWEELEGREGDGPIFFSSFLRMLSWSIQSHISRRKGSVSLHLSKLISI